MNQVHLFGNLGAEPELRVTGNGNSILKLRLATNERVKRGEEWVDHTEWHRVTVFGKRAEGLAKILEKGSKVLVAGKIRTSSYEKDGEKRYSTEIIADEVELGGKGGPARSSAADDSDSEPNSSQPSGNDDIPF